MSFNKDWADRPAVTVCVTTYDHEPYLAQALDSILAQETDFNVYILVHDDCSNDGTTAIMRDYEERHPEQIRCIYQTVNQHSQGVRIQGQILAPLVQTEFTALNEGDDFWVDPTKLQCQYDHMMAHPDCALCCHSAYEVYEDGERTGRVLRLDLSEDDPSTEISVEKLIMDGSHVPTNSYFYRQSLAPQGFPQFYNDCVVGDYPMILYFGSCGTVYFDNRPMSAYRTNSRSSWTRSWQLDPAIYVRSHNSIIDMLATYDSYTDGRYHKTIEKKRHYFEFENAMIMKDRELVLSERFRDQYMALPFSRKLKFQVATLFPFIMELKKKRSKRRLQG